MKKIFISIIFLFVVGSAFAQPDNLRADLDYLFGMLDKTKVTTGYLGPYGMDAIDKDDFNGILADSNSINSLDLFRFLYADIFSARFSPTAPDMSTIETVNNAIQSANPNSLAIFYANYNEFNENAINLGLLSYNNGRLYDNFVVNRDGKKIQSAYVFKKLFAVNQLTQAYENTVTLRYDPALFFTNTGSTTIQDIWINFGNGYTQMYANTDYSYTYTDSTGYHRIAIKATMSNGDIVETYTTVMVSVTAGNSFSDANLANPDIIIPATSTQSGARVYIRRSVNTPAGSLLRPLIVAEGLDFHDGTPILKYFIKNYSVNNLLREWRSVQFNSNTIDVNFDNIGQYDLVFIDWGDSFDDITRNAITMEQIINQINSMKSPGAADNVVIGISMGGLIARYSLASMVKRNLNTQTRLLITHDSPHQGAYIPLAFQHLLKGLQNRTILGLPLDIILQFGLQQGSIMLNRPAPTQQLLMRVVDGNGTVQTNTFLSTTYRDMVTFSGTQQPPYRFVATSQGSQCGFSSMPVGGNLINGEAVLGLGGPSFIASAGMISKFKYRTNIASNGMLADGSQHEILYFRWRREMRLFFGLINSNKTLVEIHQNEPVNSPNILPLESVAGGVTPINSTRQSIFQNDWQIITVGVLGFDYRFTFGNRFTFVPLISALDVANPTSFNRNNIFNFVANQTSPAGTFIPQQIIGQESYSGQSNMLEYNRPHTTFTSRNARWIFNEMQNIAQPFTCEDQCQIIPNMQITGFAFICNQQTYDVTSLPPGSSVSWQVTPSGLVNQAFNGNQLILTRVGNGYITIRAFVNLPCFQNWVQLDKNDVGVGVPFGGDFPIFGPVQLCTNQPGSYTTIIRDGINYSWNMPGFLYGGGNGPVTMGMAPPWPGTGTVQLTLTNQCGTGLSQQPVQFINCYSKQYVVNPNPARGSVNISVKQTDLSGTMPDKVNNKQTNTTLIYAVKIVDQSGLIKKVVEYKAGISMASLILSGIIPGNYILSVYDGKNWEAYPLLVQ